MLLVVVQMDLLSRASGSIIVPQIGRLDMVIVFPDPIGSPEIDAELVRRLVVTFNLLESQR